MRVDPVHITVQEATADIQNVGGRWWGRDGGSWERDR